MKISNFLKFFFFSFFFLFSFCLDAAQVKRMDLSTGVLTLDDNRQAVLAGLNPSPDSLKTIAVILADKEIEIEEESDLKTETGISSFYIWIRAAEIDLPFKPGASVRETKFLLNEFLLKLGLASVNEKAEFKRKESFLKVQEEARRLGQGIWSAEPPLLKKKS